jgi:hypothetical protein
MVVIFLVKLAGRGRAHFFCTISRLIRELVYRLEKRLDDRKAHYPFPRYTFITEPGPLLIFKTRPLGNLETIISRILRL